MVAIDKIYVKGYENYLEIRDYFLTHEFDTADGNHIKLKDYLYYDTSSMSEEEAKEIEDWYNDGGYHPVTNTPHYVDAYLYHNCDIPTVQEHIASAYDNPAEYLKEKDNGSVPTCRGVRIVYKGKNAANYPIRLYNSRTNRKNGVWYIEVDGYGYNSDRDKWYPYNAFEPWTSSMMMVKNRSFKSLVRRLKKWGLPAGVKVYISGRCVGEEYKLITK